MDQPPGEPSPPGPGVLHGGGPVEQPARGEILGDAAVHDRRQGGPGRGQRQRLLGQFSQLTGVKQQQLQQEQLRAPVASAAGPLPVCSVESGPVRMLAQAAHRLGEVEIADAIRLHMNHV
jgi:hypothetical protein